MPAIKSHHTKTLGKAGKESVIQEGVETQHIHTLILLQSTVNSGLPALEMIGFL
ncbi:MAG: hypothetical protein GYA52_00380 [Chloroflexi bacterium]|nr:hypothetical protein [Chloroflexota bacterium]